jgi:lipoprotein NlpI
LRFALQHNTREIQETSVSENAFVRGAPLPPWAQPMALPLLPDAPAARPSHWARLADTQLWAGERPSYFVHRAEQVNDAGALSQIGQVSVQFNPQYQRLLLHRVQILREDAGDGGEAIDHTWSAEVRFLQRESALEQGIVSGVVTATMVLSDVRVGDTLELSYTVEGENPIFEGRYAGWAGWDQSHPVALRHVALVAPLDKRIHWRWLGDRPGARPTPTERIDGELRRLEFEGRQLPGVPFEPYVPRDAHPLRWLQFTEFDSWADVARWARALFPADAALPQSLEPLLQRLRALPTAEQQATQALQWVQGEIRYYSVSLGESSHRPHTPEEVVARRYGDCKDKSFLLSRILNTLGIEAWPTLVAAQTRQAPLKLLPSPEAFDHVIVTARVGAREFWLDATRLGQSGPLERMGQGMEDAAVLVVAPQTTTLARVHSPNREQLFANELIERYVIERFGAPAVLESEQHWFGLGAESLRAMLARMDAAQLAQWALGRYERRHPGVQLDGAPSVVHDAELNRLSVRARYSVAKPLQETDEAWTLRFHPSNLHGAFLIPESLSRAMPLAVPSYPGHMQYVIEVQWPQGVSRIEEPGTERLETPHFQLKVTRGWRGNLARETVHLQPIVPSVPANALHQLVDDMRRIDQLVQGQFSVQRDDVRDESGVHQPAPLQQRLAEQLRAQAERCARAIARGHLHGEDLAQSHALRAEALAELGDSAAALRDAEAALHIAPALAKVWMSRGKVLWSLGRFGEAAQDFGRALQLDGDPFAAYLQRGQARFYEGGFEQATGDFARAADCAADESQRLHALAWQGWAARRCGRALPEALQRAASGRDAQSLAAASAWPRPALALIAGSLSAEQLIGEASRAQGDARELALLEAWFTLGQHHLVQGDAPRARDAFAKAREAGVTRYAEHAAAGFELQRLSAGR